MMSGDADETDAGCPHGANCLCRGEVLPTESGSALPDLALTRQPIIEQAFSLELLLREIFIPPKLAA